MEVPEVTFKVEINGKDATKDLTPYLISLTYTDNLMDKADELEVTVDNSDFRFLNKWMFVAGQTVRAWIGNMYCGRFTIDQPHESGPPDIAGFKAQSALFNGPIRTPNSFTHYKKSLKQIVNKYASDYQLKVSGTIPDINLETVIQYRQSDIEFLHELAGRYGCYCAVKGNTLVFDGLDNIWKKAASKTIYRRDVISYNFYTEQAEGADAGIAGYNDIDKEEVNESVVVDDTLKDVEVPPQYEFQTKFKFASNFNPADYQPLDDDYQVQSNIVRIVKKKAESKEEAKLLAQGALLQTKLRKHMGTITMPGNELLVAGNSINLVEWGRRGGYWPIISSTHHIDSKGGYTTKLTISHGAATTGAKVPAQQPVQNESAKVNKGTGGAPFLGVPGQEFNL